MVKARLGTDHKVLIVFDYLMSIKWRGDGRVTEEGIKILLKQFIDAGVPFHEMSAVTLTDALDKPKSGDYKAKIDYIKDLIETNAYNCIITIGATAFEKITGLKGASKYFGKTVLSSVYPGQKVIGCPSPAQAKHDPGIIDIIAGVVRQTAIEKEFPELRHAAKLETHYHIISTPTDFNYFYHKFMSEEGTEFAYDLETTGFDFNIDEITTIQLSHKPGFSYLIPCNTLGTYPAAPCPWTEDEWGMVTSKLKTLFMAPGKLVVGHNKKFDDKFIFHHWGIPLRKENCFDTMIASFLCDENTPNGLKELTCKLTDMGDYELELETFKDDYCKKNKILKKASTKNPDKPVFSYGMIPFDILSKYALCDSDATIRLYHYFLNELRKEEQEDTFRLVMRITWLLTRFELNGWPVDVAYAEILKVKLQKDIEELQAELLSYPPVARATDTFGVIKLAKENEKRKTKLTALKEPLKFNFNSVQHKSHLFFDVLRFPVVKKTKKGKGGSPATDKEALSIWMRTIPEHREFLRKLQHYGEATKFLSTYVIGILNKTVNGRVHPTYNAVGAKTGRTSSTRPNFQNLPARGDDIKMKLVKAIKMMIAAPDGTGLLGADLGAIEMRWACIVSGDTKLEQIFKDGIDIHGAIAKELFDYIECHPNEVKKKYEFERNSVSKTVQFLSIYGGGPDALSKKVNESIIERQELAKSKVVELSLTEYTRDMAQEILDDYFRKYQGVSQYIKDTTLQTLKTGYAVSPYGFRRRVPAVHSDDDKLKGQAVRQAVNATIQNPASVSLLLALCDLQEEIDCLAEQGDIYPNDFLLLGAVHDAGYCQVNSKMMLEGRDLLLKHLTKPPLPNCPIPICADAEWGKNWAEFSEDFGTALVDMEESDEEEETDSEEE